MAAAVAPTLLKKDHCMARTGGADNLIALRAKRTGEQRFFGAGAGGYPTAGNVLADCLEIARGCASFYTESMRKVKNDPALITRQYYIRGAKPDRVETRLGEGYITVPMTSVQVQKMREENPALFAAALAEEA